MREAARIRAGRLFRAGLLDDSAVAAAAELLHRVEVEGIETIRLNMVDPHGILRGKTVTAEALPAAFTDGLRLPSTLLLKDLAHRTVFPVWDAGGAAPLQGAADVLLVPDAATFRPLPWSPHSAQMLCDVALSDGTPLALSGRAILGSACARLGDAGYAATFGLEVEFNLFTLVEPSLDHADTTMPGRPPRTRAFDQGYQYLTETRYDAAEPVLDEIRRAAQGMEMPVRSVEIEMGPGQVEFTFGAGDPRTIADMAVTFRTLVREICARRGLVASFMPKPAQPNAAANGWHLHQSLSDGDGNLFARPDGPAMAWIAGLLDHAAASCLLTNPTVTSYKRFAPFQLAPERIGWGTDNRGALVRALLDGSPAARVENRGPDSAANPYLAITAQILSGLDGIARGLTPPPPLDNPYDPGAARLPHDLGTAIAGFAASTLYRDALGDAVVDYLVTLKRAEWARYMATVTDWEQAEYFDRF